MKLKTYIINLEKSVVRRQYMQELLQGYEFLDIEFLKAIDGRLLTQEERESRFNYARCKALYGRTLNAGEVGCALSHRAAYKAIAEGGAPYALVFEDDISIQRDLSGLDLEAIDSLLNVDKPRVLMLSGDYSFYKKKPIVRLYSAVGAYAYILNKAAARRILAIEPPCSVADDWMFYKRNGLKLYAVCPYMVDANVNMDLLSSDVKQDSWSINRSLMSKKEVVIGIWAGAVKKLFKLFRHFEYKVRILDNVVVERPKNPLK